MNNRLPWAAPLAAAAFVLSACAAIAQEEEDVTSPPPPPPPPACATDAAPYRDFDFWVGNWDVFDTDGNQVGTNIISTRENGCLILEEWTSAGGGTGTSMNFYDPHQQAWRQVWQSAGAFIDYTGGLDDDGAMALEGVIVYNGTGQEAPFRGRWTAQDDGSVLQEFWQYDAEADTWNTWFVGVYRRQSETAPAEDGDG